MKKKAMRMILAVCLPAVIGISGCGSSSAENMYMTAASKGMADVICEEVPAEAAEEMMADTAMPEAVMEENGMPTDAGVLSERKLIKNVDMYVETENLTELLASVEARVKELGGYIEYSDVYNRVNNYRSADIRARIPAEKLDSFVTEVTEQTNVRNRSERVEDVTLTYVDLESHKKVLKAEQERLLELLEKAENLEDILAIENRLSEIRYQIESMEAQLRTYDNLVSYSTLSLSISEVIAYSPAETESTWERIRTGFTGNLKKAGNGITEFFIEFVIALPLILTAVVPIGIVLLAVFLIVRSSQKHSLKRRAKLTELRPEQEEEKKKNEELTDGNK